jgi:NADH:ubiquinone oxidoreductase subunit 6 (subunit J)
MIAQTLAAAAAAAMMAQAGTVSAVLFYLFAAIAAVSALTMVLSRNVVRTAVCLLFTLVGVAGLYFLLEAEFLAAVQLVIYAGGTLILIIFGVMLTSKSPFAHFEPKLGEVVIAMSVGIVLLAALLLAIRTAQFAPEPVVKDQKYPVAALGQALLGDYLVPFELASVILLVVMIGAGYLAKARRHESKPAGRTAVIIEDKSRQWN